MSGAMSVLRSLVSLVKLVSDAITDGKPERVSEIVPPSLATTLAKAVADAKAAEKFDAAGTLPMVLPGDLP